MSYGIVRVQKMGGGSVKGIEIHDRREKEGISHTNQDIDWSRSQENYNLHPRQNDNFYRAVKERIAELDLPRAVRKDAVVMAQVLVTSDHSFFEGMSREQQQQFFKDSYEFLAERYGRENIVSSTVHLDERTPHMHFNFVPVTEDGRLSAKSVLTRQSLIEQQDKFQEEVGQKYGLERGERGGKKQHLEVIDYKAATRAQELERTETRIEELEKETSGLEAKSQALSAQVESRMSYVEKIHQLPKGKEKMFGKVEFTQEEAQSLIDTAKCFYRAHARAEEMTAVANQLHQSTQYSHLQELEQTIGELQHTVDTLKKDAEKVSGLEGRCEQLQKNLNWYHQFYDDLVLNVMERVSEKDKEWLCNGVLPKWAVSDFQKDFNKVLDEILHPKHKVKGLELEL